MWSTVIHAISSVVRTKLEGITSQKDLSPLKEQKILPIQNLIGLLVLVDCSHTLEPKWNSPFHLVSVF